ncbi:maleylpyruvate isomerase family mycothiol-dependent enzyme [Oerskovia merdavium]|uniref:Maleylpyruvate isomerase family mycothiol-dependent enzyme n=1 Tax=Oerskovia merdavium TaxID=2762227 RepID=A0ABR8U3K6_9CELL|nr:maleylpyruvate isomerase family mycothiol-dependent enzyme [Oerskovia merdavium]MBD7982273.1 maleylpyruvate isomerase family mycothiol-dependent enzyme [Oerskovia merdavium]
MTGTTQDTTAPRSIDPAPTSPLDSPQAAPRDDLPAIRRDAAAALRALTEAVLSLDDEALGSPSSLDGWSVGHVLSHVAMVGDALARQAELAAQGETAEVYEGGAEGRAAGIEAGAHRTGDEHVDALTAAGARLEAAWSLTDSTGWGARVTYRDGTVADVLDCWWREVRIHATDLGEVGTVRGLTPSGTWGLAFTDHLLDFLSPRLPGPVLVVRLEDGARSVVGPEGVRPAAEDAGDDDLTTVTGSAADVAAWLAGRATATDPTAHRDGETVDLPALGPWPSGVPVRR